MLVHSNSTDGLDPPVGIAVSEWKVNGKQRIFILYPISHLISADGNGKTIEKEFVEIGCATEEDGGVEIIAPATDKWKALDNGFGDDSYGYPYNEQTREDLYGVWDDGAKSNMQAAQRLYKVFSSLIKYYDADAWKYLEDAFIPILEDARAKGWETTPQNLLGFPLDFPYELER